ncbi:hypothetical protein M436DRAFT_77850 [Aureobasidium namibiae CBS 147.97]|uniref:Uncharacterized protein n=1 Tax=Aureobasidium namibiae CBS 147.97 TaxID=1043004 RepID=A0A074WXM9_9PEZI
MRTYHNTRLHIEQRLPLNTPYKHSDLRVFSSKHLIMDGLSASQLFYIVFQRELAEAIAAMQRQQAEDRILDAITEMFKMTWISQDNQQDQEGGSGESAEQVLDDLEEDWVLV